jgi:hypothetical protein
VNRGLLWITTGVFGEAATLMTTFGLLTAVLFRWKAALVGTRVRHHSR